MYPKRLNHRKKIKGKVVTLIRLLLWVWGVLDTHFALKNCVCLFLSLDKHAWKSKRGSEFHSWHQAAKYIIMM